MIGQGFKQGSFEEAGHYLKYGKSSNGNAVGDSNKRVAWTEGRNLSRTSGDEAREGNDRDRRVESAC